MDAVLNKYPSASERFSGAEVKKVSLKIFDLKSIETIKKKFKKNVPLKRARNEKIINEFTKNSKNALNKIQIISFSIF